MESTQKKSEIVTGRRGTNTVAVNEFVNGMVKKMTRVEISRGVDELLGRVGTGITWNDTGVAIAQLLKDGKLQERADEGKKRTFYMKTIAEETAAEDATAPAE